MAVVIDTIGDDVEIRNQHGVLLFRTRFKDVRLPTWFFNLMGVIWYELFAGRCDQCIIERHE